MKHFDISQAQVTVGLNAFSFNDELVDYVKGFGRGMTVFDLIDWCAMQRIQALDLTAYYLVGYPDVPPDNYLYEVKRYARKRGVILCGTGVKNDFADPDPARRQCYVQLTKNWIVAAQKMGVEMIRVFSGVPPKDYREEQRPEVVARIVECLRECAVTAEEHGVILGLQHHADMLRTADETIDMLRMIDSSWVGVVLDTGNFMTPDPYEDIDRIMPYVVNWQLKESAFGHNFDLKIDLRRIMKIIRKHSYRGFLPVETLNDPTRNYDPYTLVPAFIREIEAAIAEEFSVVP